MHELRVNATVIRLLQFTDLHLGEDDSLDEQTISFMRSAFQQEQPDFAVFSGDLVSGYSVWSEKTRQSLWQRAVGVCEEFHVPFATLFGNHDDQPYREDSLAWNRAFFSLLLLALMVYAQAFLFRVKWRSRIIPAILCLACCYVMTAQSKSTRLSLLKFERQAFSSLSYTQQGPGHVHGASNYRVVLHTALGPVGLYFIDSGGGRIPEDIHETQISWLSSLNGDDMPSIAFVHISPFPADLYHAGCVGPEPLEASSSVSGGMQLLNVLHAFNTVAVFMGHDHGNEWCCQYQNMLACYGKHSGYGGYSIGPVCPGARVIELHPNGTVHTRIVLDVLCSTSHLMKLA